MANSPLKPFYATLVLAFVCSFLVASASVGLRSRQEINQYLDQKKNILRAAGLYRKDVPIKQLFASIEPKVIELSSGKFINNKDINPAGFNQRQAVNNPELSHPLAKNLDIAGLRRLENYSMVYLVKKDNRLDAVILPIRGSGLWSTMYGYLALNADLDTIRGITFYEHGETPGLGGEIENPVWQSTWQGKKIYSGKGVVDFKVTKGGIKAKGEKALHRVDGISGATLTSNGVDNLLHFWFGDYGFKPFLMRMRQREGK